MKCIVCKKEDTPYNLEIHGLDGDFIHKKCKKVWQKFCEEIDSMSDEEFINFMSYSIDKMK